eukprot:COSAG01_NODE_4495_length_4976_cov_16.463605_3_plen_84_part_00
MCRMISYSNSSPWGALKRRSAVVIVNLTGHQSMMMLAVGDSYAIGNCAVDGPRLVLHAPVVGGAGEVFFMEQSSAMHEQAHPS